MDNYEHIVTENETVTIENLQEEVRKLNLELEKKSKLVDDTRYLIKQYEDEIETLRKTISGIGSHKSLLHKLADGMSKYKLQSPIKRRG